ncbi:hypothetical protein MMC18_008519 [Xylographa bjoerkii]|nr:hypothetical protein [Xylographa bjoerkii]
MDPHLRKRNETEFLGLARERFEQERLSPTKEQTPKRLYDIYTGQFTEDTAEKAFVIVSYVWSPEELPKFPKLGKYYKTEYFEGMITCASKIKNKQNVPLLEVDGNLEAKLSGIRLPDFDGQPVRARREYFQEVFVLLSAEAVRRGIKYVWMDSLCIDQKNLLEKAEEIPHMAAYYAQAVCCVVVSEMLRRRYSNEWEYRGRDEFAEKSGLGGGDFMMRSLVGSLDFTSYGFGYFKKHTSPQMSFTAEAIFASIREKFLTLVYPLKTCDIVLVHDGILPATSKGKKFCYG